MAISQAQKTNATANQNATAHDSNSLVRLIAGPGTGKSFTIQERVNWLLQNGIPAESIFVISFTRASASDLRERIHSYCLQQGQVNAEQVNVSTLHSLGLKALRIAQLLAYPSLPVILDDWEIKDIFDAEFSIVGRHSNAGQGYTVGRCGEIRHDYEAFCGTGQWVPPGMIQPDPPILPAERVSYSAFHGTRTQVYSCVLPGEIVRQCAEQMEAGIFNPVTLLGISHLIVDEYQDLNPVDLKFIDLMINQGVQVFVSGDDDQSIYSFRFASPQGIQLLHQRFPNVSSHEIVDCFRCTPNILAAAHTLIQTFADPNRLPKQTTSLYANAVPPESGIIHRFSFTSGVQEARVIAALCNELRLRGFELRDIMILISNRHVQLNQLTEELDRIGGLPYESPRAEPFIDTRVGRFIFGILRVICNPEDYLAYRLILGQFPNVGPGTCNQIVEIVSANFLNYKDIFCAPIPNGIFNGRALKAINNTRTICAQILGWQAEDSLQLRMNDLNNIILSAFGPNELTNWQNELINLPQDMYLKELRDYFQANNSEELEIVLEGIYNRLGVTPPPGIIQISKIRIMTFHGAKGLSAKVVIIPGLEEDILPGQKRRPYHGLVLEAARMLYVSITRAKAACVLSYAEYRHVNGVNSRQTPSRFLKSLNGPFVKRTIPLDDNEIDRIIAACNNL